MRNRGARHGLAALAGAALVLAACAPAPPEPPPEPTTTTQAPVVLPAAPVGAEGQSLDPLIPPADAPDPFVLVVDPTYCVDSTTTADVPGACYLAFTTQVGISLVPVWRSTDLATWTPLFNERIDGNALPDLAPWTRWGGNWAPSVLHRPGNPVGQQWVMWYTATEDSSGLQCLGVATAEFPEGPYTDTSSEPAYCQTSLGGTIDASPFVDVDDTAYLTYKSEAPAKLWISRLAPDGLSLVSGTEHFLYQGPGYADSAVVEAPTMVRVDGTILLFYSTGDWSTSDYRVGVVQCDGVDGPCFAKYSSAVLASRGSMLGPGGQTPFVDANGGWQLMFHAWRAPNVGYPGGTRSLHLLPITFTGTDVRIG